MPNIVYQGRRLHYSDTQSQAEAVLLLHGLGSRGEDWQPQTDALKAHFRVLTLDFAGHGASEALKGATSMVELGNAVLALLDSLELSRVHLVGLSLGGMVAFQLFARHPERLQSMTIINSGPGLNVDRWKIQSTVLFRTVLIKTVGLNSLAKLITRKLFPQDQQAALRAAFMESIGMTDRNSYLSILRAIGDFNVWNELDKHDVPTLVIAAENDYTPISYKQDYIANMRHATLVVIKNSGHATPMDQPNLTNSEIISFVTKNRFKKHEVEEEVNH